VTGNGSVRLGWAVLRRRVTSPVGRIYCFPHAGGSPGEYLRWADELPRVEVWGLLLPGRGPRRHEPLATSMADLAAAIVAEAEFQSPYVLFGHSFGALLAYHVAQRLRETRADPPRLLVLSGCTPPHLPYHQLVPTTLPDDEFLRRLDEAYGGVPAELHDKPELAPLVLPAYRADLAILERYADPGLPPLACPVLVAGGDRDQIDGVQLAEWARHTTAECQVRLLPGGHFYFRAAPAPLLALLHARLTAVGPGHD
jgi:surfactin synthase thioesterase subunit